MYTNPPGVYANPARVYAYPSRLYANPPGVYANPPGVYANPARVYANPPGVYAKQWQMLVDFGVFFFQRLTGAVCFLADTCDKYIYRTNNMCVSGQQTTRSWSLRDCYICRNHAYQA